MKIFANYGQVWFATKRCCARLYKLYNHYIWPCNKIKGCYPKDTGQLCFSNLIFHFPVATINLPGQPILVTGRGRGSITTFHNIGSFSPSQDKKSLLLSVHKSWDKISKAFSPICLFLYLHQPQINIFVRSISIVIGWTMN